jgi:predicted acylesterase/phospholipase RssA
MKQRISAFWKTGALFSDQKFRKEAEWWTKGQTTFLEAYQLTGRVLNITVVSTESHSKSKVLNYINTPHVTINSAVVASSSIPGILPACQLFMKDSIGNIIPYHQSGRFWRDGSMRSDIPEQELHQMFRVKYTVVSQVNPHISLFFYSPQGSAGCPTSFRNGRGFRGGYLLSFLVKYFLLDIFKWLQILRDMHLMPWFLGADFSNVFLQRFEGNVTILPPPPTFRQLFELLRLCDPDRDGLNVLIDNGQQSTWPKIKMISNRMHIEQKIRYWLALCK